MEIEGVMAKNKAEPKPEPMPLRLEWLDADMLDENPSNWRTHPEGQMQALDEVISEVGWAGALLFNEASGRLIDGHARKNLGREGKVPVLIGSWTEEQEKKILATLDPLAGLAEADKGKLDALLQEVKGSKAIDEMLSSLAKKSGLDYGLPEPGKGGDEFDPTPEAGPTRCQLGDLWLIDCYYECEQCKKVYSYEQGKQMKECPCG